MTRVRRIAAAAALAPVLLTGCTDWALYDVDYALGEIPAITFMRTSVGFDPYDMPRLSAEGSVPVGSEFGNAPAPFTQAQLDSVAATLTSPYAGSAPPEVLERGEYVYNNQCSVCHGPTGAGDGQIIGGGRFPFSLPANSGTAVARSDGYLYGVVVVGRGLMPPYGDKLNHADRWAVVSYMRELQGGPAGPAATPEPAAVDLPAEAAGQTAATPEGDAALNPEAPVGP